MMRHCRETLEKRLSDWVIVPPKQSILLDCARDTAGMVMAYYNDGQEFLSCGDHINALASFSYALGWMDAAICLGLFSSQDCGIPIATALEQNPGQDRAALHEKTTRYHSILSRALGSLEPAPELDTCLSKAGLRFLLIGNVFYDYGSGCEGAGNDDAALAAYSYGFGWLDAGIRTGLLKVTMNRELFTV
jgi:hypothetical protein